MFYYRDKATFNPNQTENINLEFKNADDDQPKAVEYGPAFFESYHTLGDARFIHGLNFVQNDSLAQTESAAAAACKGIGANLDQLELGNEPNIGKLATGLPLTYSMDDYIADWNWKSQAVASAVSKACQGREINLMSPSFIVLSNNILEILPMDVEKALPPGWNLEDLFEGGYDTKLVKEISVHK